MRLTREQSRRVDRLAVEEYGMSSLVLMENAGRGTVDVLLETDPTLFDSKTPNSRDLTDRRKVAILAGKGNNAGDGFVVARHLEIRGVACVVCLLGSPEQLTGDARANYKILEHTCVPIVDLSGTENLCERLDCESASVGWIVDALLGTGARGEPRPPFDAAIDWMNLQPARRLALDVPSGLDCDTGQAAAHAVRADVTCTYVAEKVGFFQNSIPHANLGEVHVVSIGVPPGLVEKISGR
jgi:NAD(P)H-hydrate epimerase